eukprot:91947_1
MPAEIEMQARESQISQKVGSPRPSAFIERSEACGFLFGIPGWVIFFGAFELMMILFYGFFTTYGNSTGNDDAEFASVSQYYTFFQDVHVIIFVGFGFLMVFLRKHGYSSIGFNFLAAVFTIQWSILVVGFFHSAFDGHFEDIKLDVTTLIAGDFAAGAVLISFGAVLGRVSAPQILTMALLEIVFYAVNEQIAVQELLITDIGGSMIIHTFGAYFGLAVSWMLGPKDLLKSHRNEDQESVYHSDLFSMIGTLF